MRIVNSCTHLVTLFLVLCANCAYSLESSTITIYNNSSGTIFSQVTYPSSVHTMEYRGLRNLRPDATPKAFNIEKDTIEAGKTKTVHSTSNTGKALSSISIQRANKETTTFTATQLRNTEKILVTDTDITLK